MKKTRPTKPPSEEYQRFEKLAKALIAVPKSEMDKREAEYQRNKKAAKKRKAARVNPIHREKIGISLRAQSYSLTP